MISMEKGHISGMMVENIQANGKIIKCEELDNLHGLMVENMLVNILKIKNMEKVNLHGQMVDSIQECGKMKNSMVKVYLKTNTML